MAIESPGLCKCVNEALVKIMPELNVVKLFSYDFSPEFSDYGLTCKVPIVTSPTVAEFKMEGENMNDYETSSGGITYATV